MENGGWPSGSVLECGGWRGTGLAPLWQESSSQIHPTPAKAACAPTPHPPHSKTWRIFGAWLTFLALTISVRAQSYSIDWSKIGGGGGTGTSAVYSVTGTIGQADAGHCASASYTLDGGFWGIIAAVQTPGAPYLWVMRTTTNTVCVWWAVCDPAWTLQTCTDLASSGGSWASCSYQTNGANCYYVEAPPAGSKFYRLRKP
jgi:hypothetical protein